jgi:hypothetical protein
MKPLTLPDAIATYFEADQKDPERWAQCFTPQAVVRDEGQTHEGLPAIKTWRAQASTRYSYRSEPFAIEQQDGDHIVLSHVVGNFPGSPVDLRYRFRLAGGLIAALEIGA